MAPLRRLCAVFVTRTLNTLMKTERIKPTAEDLQERFIYDPDTGEFRLRKNGKLVGTSSAPSGYIILCYNWRNYSAHRVAYLIMTGDWPEDEIDHINRDTRDNRWVNLRPATKSQNLQNRPAHNRIKPTTSRFKGVCRIKEKWCAQICSDGRKRRIGVFESEIDAARAYDDQARKLHGEFAYLNFPEDK